MDMPLLFLLLLFLLSIGHLVTLKICSVALDHRTAPVFISGWTLIGLACVFPLYGALWDEGLEKLAASPWLFLLIVLKAVALYALFIVSQSLMKDSLSSRHYVTPMAVGLIAAVNYFLGEHLTAAQWMSALGLCGLSVAFFFKGHMSDLSRQSRIAYFQLVGISVVTAAIDHTLTRAANWFVLLLLSNVIIFALALGLNRKNTTVLKTAFLHKSAILAGVFYAATELVKFYQQVTINPVSVVVTVQALTKPVILVLSALIWKERTVKEQLTWGLLAFALAVLPLLYGLK